MTRCVCVNRRGGMLAIPTRMAGRRGMRGSSRVWRRGRRVWLMLRESYRRNHHHDNQANILPRFAFIYREIHRGLPKLKDLIRLPRPNEQGSELTNWFQSFFGARGKTGRKLVQDIEML